MNRRVLFSIALILVAQVTFAAKKKIPMQVKTYEVEAYAKGNTFTENVYLIYRKDDKSAIIIDPGNRSKSLESCIRSKKLQVKGILITHGHHDHIGAVKHYADLYKVPVWGHSGDKWAYKNEHAENAPTEYFNTDTELKVGEFVVKAIATPGHSPGCTCYLIGEYLFTGDTLFKEGVGSTWGKEQKMTMQVRHIKNKLLTLPEKTEVYPGHGEATTIRHEARNNEYLQD